MSGAIINPLGPEKARAMLEKVFVLLPEHRAAIHALEETSQTRILISGGSVSGRSAMASMAACVLYHRGLLRSMQPLGVYAMDFREKAALLKKTVAEAVKEGRLLIIDEADAFCLFPEEEVRSLLQCLQQPGLYLALLVHNKMRTALEQLIDGSLTPVESMKAPVCSSRELPQVIAELAEKRWHTLSGNGLRTLTALCPRAEEYSMGDAVKLFLAMARELHARCVRQKIPEGSPESRIITSEDVRGAWETVYSNISISE